MTSNDSLNMHGGFFGINRFTLNNILVGFIPL